MKRDPFSSRRSKISASCQGRPKKASAQGPLQRGAEPVAAFGNLTALEFARRISGERCPVDGGRA